MKYSFKIIFFLFFVSSISCTIRNSEVESKLTNVVWQWLVSMDGYISKETDKNPEAFLWIPENCNQVRGIVFTQNNMIEKGILEDAYFRNTLKNLGFAAVWVTPMFSQKFDYNTKDPKLFQDLMIKLSEVSGYKELKEVPVVPLGHSSLATFPWNFAVSFPKKTLAIVSIHGDAPQTHLTGYGGKNVDWNGRNIDGIPALFVMGEYEWWEDRIEPGFKYQQTHPKSVITWLADAGHGHFDYSKMLIKYVANYIEKAAELRIKPNHKLVPIQPESGWLMDRWRKDSLPRYNSNKYASFKGNKAVASWVFDEEMAIATENYYANSRNKKSQYIGLIQNGDTLSPKRNHGQYKLAFQPKSDGVTFSVTPFFSDSTKIKSILNHAKAPLQLSLITGPATKVNDTTFKLNFDQLGFNNKKRSHVIWLLAHNDGDENYKSAVQQMEIIFPPENKKGTVQKIVFPKINNVKQDVEKIELKAFSTANQKVSYFVKQGPAYVKKNTLYLTKVPPKSKYPIKITVVAWQYGLANKVQSAKPIEQSFYILK